MSSATWATRPFGTEFSRKGETLMQTPKVGDHVSWNSHGGEAHGKVVQKLAAPTSIKTHKVAASKEEPQFLVETEEGKRAAHKAKALKRK